MGFFDDLDKATVFRQSKYYAPGKYAVKLTSVALRDGYKGQSIIIEGEVVAAAPDVPGAINVGDLVAHVFRIDGDKRDVGRNNWMQFLCAVLGAEPRDKSSQEWAKISKTVLDKNKLAGKVVKVRAIDKETRNGGVFTAISYDGIASDEDIARIKETAKATAASASAVDTSFPTDDEDDGIF